MYAGKFESYDGVLFFKPSCEAIFPNIYMVFMSLLIYTWWILYLNLSIFLPWEPDSSALHVAGVDAKALPPGVLLEYSVRLTRAYFLPSAWASLVVSDSATPWTVARQAPLYVGFSRQEY